MRVVVLTQQAHNKLDVFKYLYGSYIEKTPLESDVFSMVE